MEKRVDYKESYKRPEWQKKRLEIMERDEFKCLYCGNTEKTLHVHHHYYVAGVDVWKYQNTNFITLCEDCHSNHHKETSCTFRDCLPQERIALWSNMIINIGNKAESKKYQTELLLLLGSKLCNFCHYKVGYNMDNKDLQKELSTYVKENNFPNSTLVMSTKEEEKKGWILPIFEACLANNTKYSEYYKIMLSAANRVNSNIPS